MPLYLRAVAPTIPNLASPVQQLVVGDQAAQPPSDCVRDTNSSYGLQWSYTIPNGGPAPAGFRIQEATRTTQIFFDNADEVLVAGANSTWQGGNDWSSQVNPNTTSLAYYVPDSANQDSSLTMINPIVLPPGGVTLSFLTAQNFEDGFDQGNVEISTDGGASFTPVATYMNDFIGTRSIDISPYAGQSIK